MKYTSGPLFLLLLSGAVLYAAGPAGVILGTVTDPSARLVSGAKVTVRNEATNLQREVLTGPTGDYSAPFLDPGLYEVSVDAQGFRRAVRAAVKVDVNRTVRADFSLELGELRQVLQVTQTPPAVQTDTSIIGHVVERRRVVELPLNERNFLSFSLLVPGAQLPSDGSQNSTQGFAVSVNGAREQSNSFLLDGIDNNDLSINFYSILPSVDAIEEFQVQTNNSSAEFGRSGGAQVNVVLRSGTNSLHGSAFGFLRNRNLDARNYFDLPPCTTGSVPGTCGDIPRLDRGQYGGSVGGPIRKDRTFFFASYENLLLHQAYTREATVPSRAQRTAALAAVPSVMRNPAGVNTLDLFPTANAGTNLSLSNRYVSQPVLDNQVHQVLGRVDHSFRPSDTLNVHYGLFHEDRFNPFDPFYAYTSLPGYGSFSRNFGQNIGGAWLHSFGPNAVNEFRAGYNRLRAAIINQNSGVDYNKALGYPTVLNNPITWGYPNVAVLGFSSIGEPTNTPQERVSQTWQFSETFAWTPSGMGGKHRLKFGAEIRPVNLDFYMYILSRGMWQFLGAGGTGNPLQFLLMGFPDFAIGVQGNTDSSMRTLAQNYFVQDDIKLHPRLTLNLGLRYEFNSPPVEEQNRFGIPNTSSQQSRCSPQPDCLYIQAGTNGIPRAGYYPDRNNFAPRVGLAWRADSAGRTVVRTAYGVFYDQSILNTFVGPRFNPPFFKTAFYPNFGTSTIQTIMNQPPFPLPSLPLVVAPDFRDPYVQQWNFDVQHEIGNGFVVDAAYAGSKGTGLVVVRNTNQARPGGAPPMPQFGPWQYIESSASSNYHALQLRAEKRSRKGYTVLAAYTYSKAIDNASAMFATAAEPAFPQDSLRMDNERGLSNFDARQRLVLSGLYQLPFGRGQKWLKQGAGAAILGDWTLSAILATQTGRPFTVNRAIDQSGTGNVQVAASDRPDLIADPFTPGPVISNPDPACRLPISQGGRAADEVRSPSSWFNPCAFGAANGRFGSSGRNNLLGPGLTNLDLALLKDVALGAESRRLQIRAEAFNLLNHPNFDLPDRIFDSFTFGRLRSSNAYGTKPPRQIQIGVKYIF